VASNRRFATWLLAAATGVVALVFALALVLDASPSAEVETPDGLLGASLIGRIDLAERGIEVGLERPWLGVGLGGFEEAAVGLPPPNDHAHQVFAHAFAEGGVWLLGVAVVVPVVLARRVLALPAGPGRDVLLLAGLGLLAHAQMEILSGRIGYEVLLALLVGLAGSLGDVDDPRPGVRSGTRRPGA
jgi:O-antigen ligase